MTTREGPRQKINFRELPPQVVFREPGVPTLVIPLTYQVEAGPPRTIFIDQAQLQDKVWEQTHPDGPPPSEALVKEGDKVRLEKIRAAIEERKRAAPARTLEL